MQTYAAPARPIVDAMIAAAAAEPDRAVSFQGAPGANSHVAVTEAFPDALPLPCFSFDDALDAVKDGRAAHALIPIENSLHGRVADIHFLLPESGLVITAEHFLAIRHALMGVGARDEVAEAMSHPQALGQCRHWLKAHGIQPVNYPDTAGAAAIVAELADPRVAALAPPGAAALYGLNLLGVDIADADHNMTRFVALARGSRPPIGEATWMTTFIFEVKNVPAALFKALPFDTLKAFTPVAPLATFDLVIVANEGGDFRTLGDLLQFARQNPGKLNLGTPNIGTTQHLAAELFKSAAGLDLQVVPFKGTPETTNGLLTGSVDLIYGSYVTVGSLIDSGKVRALARLDKVAPASMTNIPTLAEAAGLPGLEDMSVWLGLVAPKGTPAAIVDKLQRKTAEILTDPAIRAKTEPTGAFPVIKTPNEFGRFIREEADRWSRVLKETGIKYD